MKASITNYPVSELKAGPLKVTTWANQSPTGQLRYSTSIRRSYRLAEEKRSDDEDDGWRISHSLRAEDLVVVAAALIEAHKRIVRLEVQQIAQALENALKPEGGE